MYPPFRVEHIGSLVRPPSVIAARGRFSDGLIDSEELRRVENDEIEKSVAWQCGAGFVAVTDGEFRRASYTDSFGVAAFDGLRTVPTSDPNWRYVDHDGRVTSANVSVVDKRLEWRSPVNVADFEFLASVTPEGHIPKMTLPGPCHIHFRSGRENISRSAYPDLDQFWEDIVTGYVSELTALHEAGCRYVQFDETSLAKFGDPRIRRALLARGDDWKELLSLYTDIINEIVGRIPDDLAIGLHLCRGNKGGAWQAEGGYEDIASSLFGKLSIRFYFLEYDSPRSGSFEPLAQFPEEGIVVLGLVSTKLRTLERIDELKRKIEEASKFVPLDRLCVSAQCGFAGDVDGTGLTISDQEAKVQLLRRLAEDVWPQN